jgi:hypothetical protein
MAHIWHVFGVNATILAWNSKFSRCLDLFYANEQFGAGLALAWDEK